MLTYADAIMQDEQAESEHAAASPAKSVNIHAHQPASTLPASNGGWKATSTPAAGADASGAYADVC
jgi:hypothetical protein